MPQEQYDALYKTGVSQGYLKTDIRNNGNNGNFLSDSIDKRSLNNFSNA
mgnify:CR=1 FL=1